VMNSALKTFPKKTAGFLNKLSKNNRREWFQANRELYDSDFLEPVIQFVIEMGDKLIDLDPEIAAIPKIDKSIFRLHRDVRFSKNKQPYKTNAGIYFWNSKAKKMESSGFYLHLEAKSFGAGVGIYLFPPHILKRYRKVVSNPARAGELHKVIKNLKKKGYSVLGEHYKKIPKGYDGDFPHSEYLLYNGIHGWYEGRNYKEISDGKAVSKIYKIFKDMSPLHNWLVKNLL
jgi:uncharacterized protein (TIGR02453 family)